MTHVQHLIERHEITDPTVYPIEAWPQTNGYLDTEGGAARDNWFAQAARPMMDQAYAWAAHRGVSIEPSVQVHSTPTSFTLSVTWEVEVGRAEDDAWVWSAYYDSVAERMPS